MNTVQPNLAATPLQAARPRANDTRTDANRAGSFSHLLTAQIDDPSNASTPPPVRETTARKDERADDDTDRDEDDTSSAPAPTAATSTTPDADPNPTTSATPATAAAPTPLASPVTVAATALAGAKISRKPIADAPTITTANVTTEAIAANAPLEVDAKKAETPAGELPTAAANLATPIVAAALATALKQPGAPAQPTPTAEVSAVAGTRRPAIASAIAAATPSAPAAPPVTDGALAATAAPTLDVGALAIPNIAPNTLFTNPVSVIAPGADSEPVTYRIATPLDSPAWPDSMAQVVRVSMRAGVSEAQLQIEPRDLGPIALRIRLEGDVAAVSFAAASADTRAILEAQLPRLRESLAASGIELGQATVDSGSREANRQGHSAQSPQVRYPNSISTADEQIVVGVVPAGSVGARLIDTFA